jgi:CRP-like cAMP-binding protein
MALSNIEALKQSELFSALPDEELAMLAMRARRLTYEPGHVIFRQGDPGNALYVLSSGEVRLTLEALPNEPIVPTLVQPGKAFGELALLDGQPRSATATTSMGSEVLMLGRDDFMGLLREEPAVLHAVLVGLSNMIRLTNVRLAESPLGSYDRLSRRLRELADLHGVPQPDGAILINREVSDAELAGLTGLHRIEVEGLLERLQLRDIIRMDDGRIVIQQPDKLLA